MALTLKALRVNAGLSQTEAATALNVTPETISRWERQKSFPNAIQISAIEVLYKTTYADINFLPESSI